MLFRNVLIFVMLPFVLCEADSGQRFFRTHFAPLLSQHYSEYFIQYLMNYEVFLLWLVRTQTITGLMKMPKIVLFVPFGCLPHPWVWSSLHTQIQWSILSWKLEETLFKSRIPLSVVVFCVALCTVNSVYLSPPGFLSLQHKKI